MRGLLALDALGLTGIWWDAMEAPPAGVPQRAHQWLGGIDSFPIHGSMDAFGGGGWIMSVADLARFMQALFAGAVFERADTLALMRNAPGHPAGSPYRLGLFTANLAGQPVYGHGGFWGTDAIVLPEAGVAIAGASLAQETTGELRALMRLLATQLVASNVEE